MNLRWPISNTPRMKTIEDYFFSGAYRVKNGVGMFGHVDWFINKRFMKSNYFLF